MTGVVSRRFLETLVLELSRSRFLAGISGDLYLGHLVLSSSHVSCTAHGKAWRCWRTSISSMMRARIGVCEGRGKGCEGKNRAGGNLILRSV